MTRNLLLAIYDGPHLKIPLCSLHLCPLSRQLQSSAVSQLDQAPLGSSDLTGEQNLLGRWQHLAIVLWVSFSIPIIRSIYYLIRDGAITQAYTPLQQRYRLAAGIIEEASALFLLWYVMGRQGKTRADIGWNPSAADVLRAAGLFLLAMIARWFVYYQVQYLYYAHSGHYLSARSLQSVLGLGVSFLSVAYACLNPFCEELIVRAYTMSEILNLGGSRTVAVIVSVVVELSLLSGGSERALADADFRGVLNLLRAEPKNIAHYTGTPRYGLSATSAGRFLIRDAILQPCFTPRRAPSPYARHIAETPPPTPAPSA